MAGGAAIADVLSGDYDLGGKPPITIPRAVGQTTNVHTTNPFLSAAEVH